MYIRHYRDVYGRGDEERVKVSHYVDFQLNSEHLFTLELESLSGLILGAVISKKGSKQYYADLTIQLLKHEQVIIKWFHFELVTTCTDLVDSLTGFLSQDFSEHYALKRYTYTEENIWYCSPFHMRIESYQRLWAPILTIPEDSFRILPAEALNGHWYVNLAEIFSPNTLINRYFEDVWSHLVVISLEDHRAIFVIPLEDLYLNRHLTTTCYQGKAYLPLSFDDKYPDFWTQKYRLSIE
jgi:hypothetical protein